MYKRGTKPETFFSYLTLSFILRDLKWGIDVKKVINPREFKNQKYTYIFQVIRRTYKKKRSTCMFLKNMIKN